MEMMTEAQRAQHYSGVALCLKNRRDAVATELRERRSAVERGQRDRHRDPVFGNPVIVERNKTRVAELEKELREIEARLAVGVENG